jgi:hypothetical protein
LPYLLGQHGTQPERPASNPSGNALGLRELAAKITPDIFRPDGNLNPREIPIALQLPDWSQWLPRVHPRDAWGSDFTESEFAAWDGGETTPASESKIGTKPSLRALLTAAQSNGHDIRPVVGAFAQWSNPSSAV